MSAGQPESTPPPVGTNSVVSLAPVIMTPICWALTQGRSVNTQCDVIINKLCPEVKTRRKNNLFDAIAETVIKLEAVWARAATQTQNLKYKSDLSQQTTRDTQTENKSGTVMRCLPKGVRMEKELWIVNDLVMLYIQRSFSFYVSPRIQRCAFSVLHHPGWTNWSDGLALWLAWSWTHWWWWQRKGLWTNYWTL